MNQKLRRGGYVTFVIAMVFAVVVAGAGGAAAAPPVIDNSTTDDTTTTSEMVNGTTIGENNTFNANSSKASVLQYRADSNSSKVYITKNGSDTVVYANTSANTVFWNTTDNDGHFNVSVNHGQLADLDRGINSNVTVDVTVVNNTSAANANETTIQVYIETDNSTTVKTIGDSQVGEGATAQAVSEEGFLGINALSDDYTEIDTNARAVNGSDTTFTLSLHNQSVKNDYANATGSDVSSGDLMLSMATTLQDGDGKTVPTMVYYKQAPDSVSNDTTYGVYKENVGGEPAIVFHLGSEFDNAQEVSATSYGNADFWQQRSVYGTLTVITGGAVDFKMPMPLSMSGGMSGGFVASAMGAFMMGAPTGRRRDVEEVLIIDEDEE